jgi:hypothetical protein
MKNSSPELLLWNIARLLSTAAEKGVALVKRLLEEK